MQNNFIAYDADEERRLETLFAQEHESEFGGKRAGREKAIRPRATKAAPEPETERRALSPYTVHTLDTAIAHLESAMNADKAMEIFGPGYWHARVLELRSTPGILHIQERRLKCLLERFGAAG
jgi:hypothetical protein